MPREYDFWAYIMTNKLDSVLYIEMTNDLTRRVSEHQSDEIPGFTADYRCHKLVYWEYYSDVGEAIAREKQLHAGLICPTKCSEVSRDVSTSLDMTIK